jgi:hypothetical protein
VCQPRNCSSTVTIVIAKEPGAAAAQRALTLGGRAETE